MYRVEAAMDGWEKVFAFFGRHLSRCGLPAAPRVSPLHALRPDRIVVAVPRSCLRQQPASLMPSAISAATAAGSIRA
jgi:hypothetical protein